MAWMESPLRAAIIHHCPSTAMSTAFAPNRMAPRMVPPRGSMPLTLSNVREVTSPSMRPRQPFNTPMVPQPCTPEQWRVTALMTALSPGQSPPPVSTASCICFTPLLAIGRSQKLLLLLHLRHAQGGNDVYVKRPTLVLRDQ